MFHVKHQSKKSGQKRNVSREHLGKQKKYVSRETYSGI